MTLSNDFTAYVDDLRSTHGSNLASVIFYGSATRSDNPPKTDVHVLVALENITPEDLRKAHSCMREWTKIGYPTPVYFTVGELSTASDVFPIEFNHMIRARRVLFGKDVLDGVEVTNANLRHQVEFELRSKLMRLRRDYIAASTSAASLVDLMVNSLPSFIATVRAAVLLSSGESPVDRRDVVRMAGSKLGLDSGTFEKIFSIREDESARGMSEVQANELFAAYIAEIEKAVTAINNF